MQATKTTHTEPAHSHEHHDPGFLRSYVFSTDHKVIGIQYGFTALSFLLFGFLLMICMRWQMAKPGEAMPIVGKLLESLLGEVAKGGIISPDLYNAFGAMHGTIMVFLAIVPLAFAAFGNYVVPLQIGAVDMAFPRVNMVSYQCFAVGGVIMFVSFFIPGGAAQAGWTSYSPLATVIPTQGQTFWILGMVFLITSSLLGAVNFIATVIQLRAPGMTWMRLPFFTWVQFVTAFILLLAFPPLEAATVLQLMDKVFGSSFFLPTGLVISGKPYDISGGGSPLLWQHLFWFLGSRQSAPALKREICPAGRWRVAVRGLAASNLRSTMRLKAIAHVRAQTIASRMRPKVRQPGQPRFSRAATTIPASAKGRAKTVCESFTNSAHLRSVANIVCSLRNAPRGVTHAVVGKPSQGEESSPPADARVAHCRRNAVAE